MPVLRGGQTSRYVVDSVQGEAASQQDTYDSIIAPLVDNFIQVWTACWPAPTSSTPQQCVQQVNAQTPDPTGSSSATTYDLRASACAG
jgi:hypothetical protein